MQKTLVSAAGAPSSPLYSQAVKAGGFVFVSGMVGLDTATGKLAGETIRQQTTQALKNCETVLHAAGSSREQIVEVQVLLVRPEDFAGMNEAYAAFFPKHPPARSVAKLGVDLPGILVSVRMTAVAS